MWSTNGELQPLKHDSSCFDEMTSLLKLYWLWNTTRTLWSVYSVNKHKRGADGVSGERFSFHQVYFICSFFFFFVVFKPSWFLLILSARSRNRNRKASDFHIKRPMDFLITLNHRFIRRRIFYSVCCCLFKLSCNKVAKTTTCDCFIHAVLRKNVMKSISLFYQK